MMASLHHQQIICVQTWSLCSTSVPRCPEIPEDSVTFDHQGFSCRRSLGLSVEEFGILSNTQLSPAEIEMVYLDVCVMFQWCRCFGLGGGFMFLLFSPQLWEMIQFD